MKDKYHFILNHGNAFRAIALHIHAIFPFFFPLKDYFNGRILRGFFAFWRDWHTYNREEHGARSGFEITWRDSFPCFLDRYEAAGTVPKHYFWQDLWAARKVYESKAPMHYDIGSRLDGFIAHCLPFCEVVMLDIRPLPIEIDNLAFKQTNCMNMESIPSDSIQSLSSLHAIEHFGLGRYGDPIDPDGHKKAILEIKRVVAVNGMVILSVPVGLQRLEFNGHRVFDPLTIISMFDGFELLEFSVVDDLHAFHPDVDPGGYRNLNYGCGLFLFKKQNS